MEEKTKSLADQLFDYFYNDRERWMVVIDKIFRDENNKEHFEDLLFMLYLKYGDEIENENKAIDMKRTFWNPGVTQWPSYSGGYVVTDLTGGYNDSTYTYPITFGPGETHYGTMDTTFINTNITFDMITTNDETRN